MGHVQLVLLFPLSHCIIPGFSVKETEGLEKVEETRQEPEFECS